MEQVLMHYGVKGMKWGIRRYQNKDGSLTAKGKQRYSSDYERAHSKKSIKEMSDIELKTRLNRLNMEAQYKKLQSGKVSKGKKFVNTALKVGTTVATASSTALTIYNNWEKINKLVRG